MIITGHCSLPGFGPVLRIIRSPSGVECAEIPALRKRRCRNSSAAPSGPRSSPGYTVTAPLAPTLTWTAFVAAGSTDRPAAFFGRWDLAFSGIRPVSSAFASSGRGPVVCSDVERGWSGRPPRRRNPGSPRRRLRFADGLDPRPPGAHRSRGGTSLPDLDVQSLWLDETVTANLLDHSLGEMLGKLADSESAPPLYYVLAWSWTQLWGIDEVALRSLSAVLGTAMIPLAGAAAAKLTTQRIGLVTAALVAVNPLLVWFSQEARVYALFAFLHHRIAARFRRRASRPGTTSHRVVGACLRRGDRRALLRRLPRRATGGAPRSRGDRPAGGVCGHRRGGGGRRGAGSASAPPAFLWHILDHREPLVERIADTGVQFLVGPAVPAPIVVGPIAALLGLFGVWLCLSRAEGVERRGAATGAIVGVTAIATARPLPRVRCFPPEGNARCLAAAGSRPRRRLGARRAGRLGLAAAGAACVLAVAVVVATAVTPELQREDWRGAAKSWDATTPKRAVGESPGSRGSRRGESRDRVYLRDAETTGSAHTREVALLSHEDSGLDAQIRGVPELPEIGVPPGFRLAERVETNRYTLLRYQASRQRSRTEWGRRVRGELQAAGRGFTGALGNTPGSPHAGAHEDPPLPPTAHNGHHRKTGSRILTSSHSDQFSM